MYQKIKIGEFAKQNHISIQTLRYYEQIGLLKPAYIDDVSKYRYYHIHQSSMVDAIHYLKQFDFSLEDIKSIFSHPNNIDIVDTLITKKQKELEEVKKRLHQQMYELSSFRESLHVYQDKRYKTDIEIITLPKRHITLFPCHKNIYDMTTEEYEHTLRRFKQSFVEQEQIDNSLFYRIGSIIKKDSFEHSHFVSHTLFAVMPTSSQHTTDLEETTYAIFYCQSFEDEIQMLPIFRKKLDTLGYKITGNYICEVIFETFQTDLSPRQLFIRMQVPVSLASS
ncbi:MerR family transcriptional regulator [Carnobacteriaceae bacterium zg-ZUI78]|nr:MerR family transcriptional regulator [Carnobacteriaceae bacterium zg-ZUI78]